MPQQINHVPAVNSQAAAFQVAREKMVSKTFYLRNDIWKKIKEKGNVKKAKGFACKFVVRTGPGPTAGLRFVNEALPSPVRTVGGQEVELTPGREALTEYMHHAYGGQRNHGLTMEAAKHGPTYGNVISEDDELAIETIGYECNRWMAGDGTGRMFEVASVSGDTVTVKQADGTVANAGQFGLHFARHVKATHVFVDTSGPTVRTDGNGNGYRVVSVDKDNGTVQYDRAVTASAGDVATEGDDIANSYGKGCTGIMGAIGDSDDALTYLGLSRGAPDHDFLDSVVIDLANGANCGELNPATIARGVIEVSNRDDARIDTLLCHPLMFLEAIFGRLIEGGNPNTRTMGGPEEQRRYTNMTPNMGAGAGKMTYMVGGYGNVDLMTLWDIAPNNLFGVDWSTFEYHQYGSRLQTLDPNNPQGLRVSGRHTYDKGWWHSFNFFVRKPWRNVRFRHALQQTPQVH